MTSYFRFDPASFGKGFITHQDWLDLSFEITGDVVAVGGAEGDAAAWALRVGATAITSAKADELKTQHEYDGAVAEAAELESRLTEVQAKTATLPASLAAIKEVEAIK